MEIKSIAIKALLVAALVSVLGMGVAYIDLLFNPWVATAQFTWVNFFTTRHYMSWEIANGYWLFGLIRNFVLLFFLIWFGFSIKER